MYQILHRYNYHYPVPEMGVPSLDFPDAVCLESAAYFLQQLVAIKIVSVTVHHRLIPDLLDLWLGWLYQFIWVWLLFYLLFWALTKHHHCCNRLLRVPSWFAFYVSYLIPLVFSKLFHLLQHSHEQFSQLFSL